jgi:hypothetical protein
LAITSFTASVIASPPRLLAHPRCRRYPLSGLVTPNVAIAFASAPKCFRQPFLEARGHLIAPEAALCEREGRHAVREARVALLGLLQLPLQHRLLVSEVNGRTPSWVHC